VPRSRPDLDPAARGPGPDMGRALQRYGIQVNDAALQDFAHRKGIKDKVADKQFRLEKKIEKHLATLCPDRVTPKYTMVTFSPHLSYGEALRRGSIQDQILARAAQIPDIEAGLTSGKHEPVLKQNGAEQL